MRRQCVHTIPPIHFNPVPRWFWDQTGLNVHWLSPLAVWTQPIRINVHWVCKWEQALTVSYIQGTCTCTCTSEPCTCSYYLYVVNVHVCIYMYVHVHVLYLSEYRRLSPSPGTGTWTCPRNEFRTLLWFQTLNVDRLTLHIHGHGHVHVRTCIYMQ